ncbi:hypothetical protein Tco_1387129 [Tanacetum coccineum]
MANLFPPLFPLPHLRQSYTSSCDCSMNIRNAHEELHNFLSIVYRTLTTIRLDIVKLVERLTLWQLVFPFIVMNCSREMQRWLLYACLEMMPFGLLKCTVRIGYSCKTPVEKFRLELHAAFENRCSFLSEQIKKGVSTSFSAFNSSSMYDTSYSSGINFHVLFPQRLDMSTHLSTYPTDNNTESRPVDHIIFFYKALKKDIEQAVSISANLAYESQNGSQVILNTDSVSSVYPIDKITNSSDTIPENLGVSYNDIHLTPTHEGPAVLNFKRFEETNILYLTTSKTYDILQHI